MKIILVLLAVIGAILACVAYQKYKNSKLPTYQNPPGSPVVDREATKDEWQKFFWDRMLDHKDVTLPEGFVIPEAEVLKTLAGTKGQNTITWLGHAAFLIRLGGTTILTDPFLSARASPFRYLLGPKRFSPPGLSVENLPPIDVLLISHNHYDHLDKETLRKLPNKGQITVVTPSGNGALLRPLGFKNIRELGWGNSAAAHALDITVLPAIHFSARTLWDRNRMLWGGFSIQSRTKKLYFSGDTTYGPVFREMEKYGPFDAGMIGIGAYAPVELMKASHASPEQAVEIAKDLKVKTIIGMHWGSVKLTTEDPFEPPVRFVKAGEAAGFAQNNLWAMKIGETRILE